MGYARGRLDCELEGADCTFCGVGNPRHRGGVRVSCILRSSRGSNWCRTTQDHAAAIVDRRRSDGNSGGLWPGVHSAGKSAMYRAVVAGLEAHVVTYLGASVAQRGYTAGVATALPIMLPGALTARRELRRDGCELRFRDTVNGVALLLPAALVCQVVEGLIRRVSVAWG